MRTKLFVLALLVILTNACKDILSVNVTLSEVGWGTDTTSTGCVVTFSIQMVGTGAAGATVSRPVGSADTLIASATGTCVTVQDFNWTSSNTARVTVSRINPTRGLMTIISAGSAQICAVHTQTGTQFCFDVNGTTGGTTTSSLSFVSSAGSASARPVGAVDTLTATCVQGTDRPTACLPHWTSSNSTRITVQGTDSIQVNGVWRRVGTRAILTFLNPTAPGDSVNICATWSRQNATPTSCRNFAVLP